MSPQRERQTITIDLLPSISKSKGYQSWNLVSLQNIAREISFFKNHAENINDTSSRTLFGFSKTII